jgi:hypothetical protein
MRNTQDKLCGQNSRFLNVKPGFKCLIRFALRYVCVYLNAPRNEWAPPPCALIMVRTALDYNPRPVTRQGMQVRRPASNQFAGCSYRAEGERISRLLWVTTNHRGDWIACSLFYLLVTVNGCP